MIPPEDALDLTLPEADVAQQTRLQQCMRSSRRIGQGVDDFSRRSLVTREMRNVVPRLSNQPQGLLGAAMNVVVDSGVFPHSLEALLAQA